MGTSPVRLPDPGSTHQEGSLVFDHLDASELAGHITHLEHKAMRRISFDDFRSYAQTSSLRDNPKLERSIALFNGLTQWVQATVLARTSPSAAGGRHRQVPPGGQASCCLKRSDCCLPPTPVYFLEDSRKFYELLSPVLLLFFFTVLQLKLQRLQNFNSLMAVVGGLSHSALARLSRTAALLPTEARRALAELSELLSSGANFGNYRRALAECQGFKIPILGVHMKDLITLHVALPDNLPGGHINVRKMVQLSYIFQELWNLQNSVPPISVHQDLASTLKIALETVYSEDEIYDLSLAREPRAFTASSKPVLFSEWVVGVGSPADPCTAERHVQAMVEVLFKNYDVDRDGVLCPEEFEALASNFPLMDDLSVLDTDQDGAVSRVELSAYCLKSNSQVLRSGFQHDFHETTYFKPTFCAHCHGLLWGLIKQGHKCRECGLNAHKHCKEHLVMECRRQSGSPPPAAAVAEKPARKQRGRQWRKLYRSQPSDGVSLEGPSPDLSPEDLQETEGLAEELKDICE
ncbi:RASGRP1 [Cordylochernes scorpioides]|uniref:RASGRP1 n=1 Tax=Cordylochernes scorpioides TaxID=51811 RepID=A0ABY6K9Y4_9ARAC|nr:RASGRP1 [Cordylochernes scorpioides]